jgi:hypothetical protein
LSLGIVADSAEAAGKSTLALIPISGPDLRQDSPGGFRPEADSVERRGGVAVYSLDFVSGGDVAAMDFSIRVPKDQLGGRALGVDQCVSALPATHMGQCRFNSETGTLKVVIFSMSNAELSTGALGQIRLPAGVTPTIVEDSVTLSDAQGKRVEAEVL